MSKVRIGLMLGGGGAKGAYQLGVIRALEEAKLLKHVKSISGTSIGAINTILLMSKKNHKKMHTIWEEIDQDNVFGTKGSIFKQESRAYSLEPLAKTLFEKIDIKQVKRSKYRGHATAALMYSKTSMFHQLATDTMEKKVFQLNQMENPYLGVLASASIPVIFGPTKVDGFSYVDGGMLDNYPVEPLIADKCNLIFAVALDANFNPFIYDNLDVNIIDFTARAAFERSIMDYLEVLKFDSSFKDEKEELGYLAGKMIINKMYEEKYLSKVLGFRIWKKRPEFSVLKLSKEDESLVKQIKLQLKKKKKALKVKKLKKENK